jgi:hypothetical protein
VERTTLSFVASAVALAFLALAPFPAAAFEAQTSDGNMVRVDVQPVQLTPGKPAVFEVRLNTHSVSLGYDIAKAASLKDSQGKTYHPAAWDGSPPGGHHRRGSLEFPTLQGTPTSVTLTLKDIAGVPERNFQWRLGG